MVVVAISGKAGSGKDYSYNLFKEILKNKYNLSSQKFAFADDVKKITSILYPQIPLHYLNGASEYRGSTVIIDGKEFRTRDVLINVGERLKSFDENVWINLIDLKIKTFESANFIPFITDLRFKKEFDYVAKRKFLTIRIKTSPIKLLRDVGKIQHCSEEEQDLFDDSYFDYVVDNSLFDQEYLASQINTIAEEITKKL